MTLPDRSYNNSVHELIVPDLKSTEIANVSRSSDLFKAVRLFPQAFEIPQNFRQPVFDCLYVALKRVH